MTLSLNIRAKFLDMRIMQNEVSTKYARATFPHIENWIPFVIYIISKIINLIISKIMKKLPWQI